MIVGLRVPTAREAYLLGALLINTGIAWRLSNQVQKAHAELKEMYEARAFLLSLFEKYNIPVDDFDILALSAHGIKVTLVEDDGGTPA